MAAAHPSLARAPGLPRLALGIDYKWQVLICCVFGTFMVTLDQTVVNIALPKITTVFGVSIRDSQLVVTSYMLALAIIMPATGFLSDTFGVKRLYLITMAMFTGGSLLCGLAWNNPSLVMFRVIQGLGGGMMSPLAMAMLFRAVPPHERNTMMGFYGLPLMLAPILGPTLGGYIVEYVDWRVIFTLNVPVGVLGIAFGWTLLRESERVRGLRFDLRGFVLSAVGFSALLLGLSDAATDGWTDPSIVLRLGVGCIALLLWVWVELHDQQPLLELRLFAIPMFTFATLVNFVVTVGMFGSVLLLPLFLQNFRGLGAAQTGTILIFQALPMTVTMPLIGRVVDRVGTRPVLLLGLPLLAIATLQFANLDLSTSDLSIRLMLAGRGLAMGFVMMPAMTAALNAAPLQQMSRASSMVNVLRQLFSALGTAIIVTLLQMRQTFHTAILSQTVTPENIPLQQLLGRAQQWGVSQGVDALHAQAMALMLAAQQVGLRAAVLAFDDVFRVAAIITLFALLPALFLSDRRSGAKHGPTVLAD